MLTSSQRCSKKGDSTLNKLIILSVVMVSGSSALYLTRYLNGSTLLHARLSRTKKRKQAGLDLVSEELYLAAGYDGLYLLAQLCLRAKHQGPPISWRGGLMWAGPRKPHLRLSPNNARALLCADHKAKHVSAAIRNAVAPVFAVYR